MLLDVPGRLAKYLLDSGSGQLDPYALTLTQGELAAAVGSTRVTVNKVLADFEHRGLIRVARRHVGVLPPIGCVRRSAARESVERPGPAPHAL